MDLSRRKTLTGLGAATIAAALPAEKARVIGFNPVRVPGRRYYTVTISGWDAYGQRVEEIMNLAEDFLDDLAIGPVHYAHKETTVHHIDWMESDSPSGARMIVFNDHGLYNQEA